MVVVLLLLFLLVRVCAIARAPQDVQALFAAADADDGRKFVESLREQQLSVHAKDNTGRCVCFVCVCVLCVCVLCVLCVCFCCCCCCVCCVLCSLQLIPSLLGLFHDGRLYCAALRRAEQPDLHPGSLHRHLFHGAEHSRPVVRVPHLRSTTLVPMYSGRGDSV